jgi:hypothetical protein
VLVWEEGKEHTMHHDNAAEHGGGDEVVNEFDQTNDKAPGLEGDSDTNEDMDPSRAGDGSADDHREPLMTTLVEDLADGGSDEERRD